MLNHLLTSDVKNLEPFKSNAPAIYKAVVEENVLLIHHKLFLALSDGEGMDGISKAKNIRLLLLVDEWVEAPLAKYLAEVLQNLWSNTHSKTGHTF